MARTGLFFLAIIAVSATLVAFDQALDPARLAEAIEIGQSRIDDVRSRFHAAYHVNISMAPVDYAEVVTPFRRIALDAEARVRAGERLYGQREALASLGTDPGRLDIVVELTFHPLNTYVGVPGYQIALRPIATGPELQPGQMTRLPRFGPRVAGTPLAFPYTAGSSAATAAGGAQPLLGGRLVASFDGGALMPHESYWILVSEAGREVARGRADFGNLR